MKALTVKTLQSRITTANQAHTENFQYELLVNAVYHGLIHGNIMATTMKHVREGNMPAVFKSAMNKHMPIKWSSKTGKYTHDKEKHEKLLSNLGLERGKSSIDEVAIALDGVLETKKVEKEFVLADYLANVAKKLHKEKCENVDECIALLALTLTNKDVLVKALKTIPTSDKKAA